MSIVANCTKFTIFLHLLSLRLLARVVKTSVACGEHICEEQCRGYEIIIKPVLNIFDFENVSQFVIDIFMIDKFTQLVYDQNVQWFVNAQ